MVKINYKKVFNYALVGGISFYTGVFFTFYKIDQRLYDETIAKAWDIQNRFYNYADEECYTESDLELIIFGEIQKDY